MRDQLIARITKDAGFIMAGILVVMMSLSACQSQEIDLPFEVMEQGEALGNGTDERPGMKILADPKDAADLAIPLTSEFMAQFEKLDYNAYFAIFVFQGWKRSGGYEVQVKHITRKGNKVTIFAQFLKPRPDIERVAAFTFPYQMVRVKKTGEWGEQIAFELVVDDAVVASFSQYVP